MKNTQELCFAVEFERVPSSIEQSIMLSTILSSSVIYCVPHTPVIYPPKKVNEVLEKKNTGLKISKIFCGRQDSTWFVIYFSITDMKCSNEFFCKMVDDIRMESYLQDFKGDWHQANAIRCTFHDKICCGLNRFFKENHIDWRIKKIESPGG